MSQTAAPHQQTFRQPLLQLSVAFASGIWFANTTHISLWLLFVPALVFTLAAVLLLRSSLLSTAAVTLAFFFIGATHLTIEKRTVAQDRVARLLLDRGVQPDEPVEVTGKIQGPPEVSPELISIDLRIGSIRLRQEEVSSSGVVRLYLPLRSIAVNEYGELELRHGARLRVITSLSRGDRFRNPGVPAFTEFLERRGYDAVAFVKSPLLIERLDDETVFLPLAWLYGWRRELGDRITQVFDETTAGIVGAALLGNRAGLSAATTERFRDGGTFHVLVISGLHISFIGGFVFLLMRRITARRSIQFMVSIGLLWSYTAAVGASSSVVRAAFMFSFVTFAPIVRRRAASVNSIGAAGLVLLVARPGDLFDPSFQLTFLSVIAIIVLSWPLMMRMAQIGRWHPTAETPYAPAVPQWFRDICELLFWSEKAWRRELARSNYRYNLFKNCLAVRLERYQVQWILRYTASAVVVSICVQLTLLPLLIVYFHRLSLASLLLNIAVGGLMAALLLLAVITLILTLISPIIATPIIYAAESIAWLMVHSVDPFRALQIASIRLPEYGGTFSSIYFVYYIPLIVVAITLSKWAPLASVVTAERTRRFSPVLWCAIAAQGIAITILVTHPYSAKGTAGELRVDFLDVGQGDAALVTTPEGTTFLIDGGGRTNFPRTRERRNLDEVDRSSRSIGETVVSEFLWSRGLSRVDYVMGTHADADHMDGLNEVVKNFPVRAAFVGRAAVGDPEYDRFTTTAALAGVQVFRVGAGDVFRLGDVTVWALHPKTQGSKVNSANDDSVVLRIEFRNRAILFTGDIEKRAEWTLLANPAMLGADVVKVAHHGSKSSSAPHFVGATRARFAVISVGQNSIFGHPHAEVVERWQASGALVLTTGNCGAITVTTDGTSLDLATFSGGEDGRDLRCVSR